MRREGQVSYDAPHSHHGGTARTEEGRGGVIVDGRTDMDTALMRVTTGMLQRFGGQLDEAVIVATVRECAAAFGDARISTFVPILVERQSIRELTARIATAAR